VPLGNSGVYPPPQTLSALNIDARMSFYGTYVLLNEQVTLQAQDPVLNEAALRLGVSLRQTEDELISSMLSSTSSFMNCTNGSDGDNPTEITLADIQNVVRTLRNNSAYSFLSGISGENKFGTAPVRDAYFALGSTQMIGQVDNVQGFIQKWNYANQQSTLDAEYGSVSNLRFLLSPIGSVTPNASLLGNDVMNIFCVGREAYATVEQDGYSSKFIYRPGIYDGPLALNASIGWTMATVPRLLNDTWCINMRCTLA